MAYTNFFVWINEFLAPIGLTLADWLILIIVSISMLMMVLDVRIGLMFLNASLAFGLIVFWFLGFSLTTIIVLFFMSMVLLTLSLYFTNRQGVF